MPNLFLSHLISKYYLQTYNISRGYTSRVIKALYRKLGPTESIKNVGWIASILAWLMLQQWTIIEMLAWSAFVPLERVNSIVVL